MVQEEKSSGIENLAKNLAKDYKTNSDCLSSGHPNSVPYDISPEFKDCMYCLECDKVYFVNNLEK